MKKKKLFLISSLLFMVLLLASPPNHATTSWDTITYDDDTPESYLALAVNDSVAVLFSHPTDIFQLTGITLYSNTSNLTKIVVWVVNATNSQIIMDPLYPPIALGVPPYTIDFGDAGPIFTPANVTNFYVVLQWIANDTPKFGIAVDSTSPAGHSYTNQSGSWQAFSAGNIMIRALITDITAPVFDHIPLKYAVEGKALSISTEVSDEFGVESVTLAYRKNGSAGSFGYIPLSRASGTPLCGIWYGQIPAANITSAGLEYYIWATDVGFNQRYYGNATSPFEVTVVQMFEMPPTVSIIIILSISAVAAVVYFLLPKYKGEDGP